MQNGFQKNLGNDFIASVVVFLVALPLCMGIAIASGAPPAAGLITGIIGGIVVGMISGSPLQVSGPAAGLAVVVWELIQDQGLPMLGVILVGAGIIQLLAGILKVGQWFRAISPAVIYGMLAGIGVLIFASQFHVMVDDKPQGSGIQNLISIPASIYKGIFPLDGSVHHIAAGIGLVTILSLLAWNRYRPAALKAIPGPLVGVLVASLSSFVLGLPIQHVNVPANLIEVLRFPTMDQLGHLTDYKILFEAAALAFVASAETLLSAAAVEKMVKNYRTNYDRELSAQGIGNMLCGFVGGLPMTGVIVRSSANVEAGAKTRTSAIMHGFWLLAFVSSLPWVLERIPTSSLAAILVFTGYKLVNPANVRRLASFGRMPLVIYFVTLIGIVATDLLTGVIAGIVLSVGRLVYEASHLGIRVEQQPDSNRVDLHLDGAATFLSMPRLADALQDLPQCTELHVHVDRVHYIDHTCMDLLIDWERQRDNQGCKLFLEWDTLQERFRSGARGDVPASWTKKSVPVGAGSH